MNAYDQYLSYELGNQLTTTKTYDVYGMPTSVQSAVQHLVYDFDPENGNLNTRQDFKHGGILEEFEYDATLHKSRLTETKVDGFVQQTMQYQTNGNISFKTDAGNYSYDQAKKNAVVQVSNPNAIISNLVQDITYTPFNSVLSIKENNKELQFTYAADQQRRKMTYYNNEVLEKTTYYFGNYEKIKLANGDITELHYIAGGDGLAAIHVITTPNNQQPTANTFYTYTDHLGSILTLTDNVGNRVFETNFDAWGRRRNVDNWTYNSTEPFVETGYDFSWLTRGYTGHEHLPPLSGGVGVGSLINMNGRLYDPILGRMLSPDNYVQDATSTQGYNRYSYVMNNPLKYTDSDGEWVNFAIGAVFGAISGYQIGMANNASGWGMVGYIFGGAAIGAASSGAAAGVSAIGGGVTAGAGFSGMASNWNGDAMLKGALTGGISGGAGGLVGAAFGGGSGAFLGGAVGSGLNTKLNGGSNEDVFKSAGIGGVTGLGLYHLTSGINYAKYRNSGETFDGKQLSYRQFNGMSADFQRSRFWKAEFGGVLTDNGGYVHRYKEHPLFNPDGQTNLNWDVEHFPDNAWATSHSHHGKAGSPAPNGGTYINSHSPQDNYFLTEGFGKYYSSFVVNRNNGYFYSTSTKFENSFNGYFLRKSFFLGF